ncbi:acetyl-CoA carboxylase biotin carboxylase subunit [Atopobacter sp. AH10]|uniref:acetyl-CoA carboxylase biotin carboxylase subunit n=1 Tax=Atopobacter sp. AH10 TaxID=2315861 RepID=UPI000EF2661B|nr:acetyl-CoA carboxylase biotin carboxylase subunit [Atopobacter sp. AH10]RLK63051.1 acetyl-CoA carboxylase biotin carboxylase subunit [Atopobacter sp. AH10]
MLKKVLIANRGEIAIRIIRACREMNIRTVAIYSKEDVDMLHVSLADEAYCIGPYKASESYLNKEAIIQLALAKSCDGIHPGYGFLSENDEFAKMCEDEGIKFIGPSSDAIRLMGDKVNARALMMEHGVNVVPGSKEPVDNLEEIEKIAEEIGYPILIKAAGGGGGKGIRKVNRSDELKMAFESARAEVKANFSNPKMYVEKCIERPRHIEVQILRDSYGNCISLGERNCSIQRNNQKVIEEAPAFNLADDVKQMMYEQAKTAAHACHYENAGTIEFIVDHNENFYFIEMNTRLQVEHTVTEMVTGIDLVKEQLRIASGFRLAIQQEDVKIKGYALEARINAEEPLKNFMPQAGTVKNFYQAGGYNVRFDSYLYPTCKISPFYDSMCGKLIVYDRTRMEAIRKLRRALEETIIFGVKTNIDFIYTILFNKTFVKGSYTTAFISENMDEIMELMEGFYQ